jgi:phage terminase large subunit
LSWSAVADGVHQIRIPKKLIPLFLGPARFRCAYGGRGSAKTRTFAKMAAVIGLKAALEGREGIVLCARDLMNSLDDSSLEEVKAAIASDEWLSAGYEVGEKFVRTKDKRVDFKFAGLRHNVDSIKSKAKVILCWVDEADPVTEEAWEKLIPTVREDDSEIWVTWNPERRNSEVDKRFRRATDDDVKCVEMNWKDNEFFPAVLEKERQRDKRDRPDQYAHIWEGDYRTAAKGAYYASGLMRALEEGRITNVARDPLLTIRTYHDIGGTGAKADLYSIIVCQFVDREIRILDHYAARGQPLAEHANWLRKRGYDAAKIILPHDGVNSDTALGKRFVQHWRDAGFDADEPYRGHGSGVTGAASQRIEAARRLFDRMWFNKATTEQLRYSLNWYSPKYDKDGNDLGPDHDDYSHDADAFGLMCVAYKEPTKAFEATALRPRFGTMA